MKRLLIAAAAMVLITSCDSKVSDSNTTNNQAAADHNAEGTKKVYHAIETGDVSNHKGCTFSRECREIKRLARTAAMFQTHP